MINKAILGAISGGRPTPPIYDQYWANVVLLCGFNGTNLSQVFADESLYGRTSTLVGGSAYPRLETTTKKFGTASVYCDGVGSHRVQFGYGSEVLFGSGDWTIEAWVKVNTSSGYGNIISRWGTGVLTNKSWFFGEREGRILFAYYTAADVFTEVATGVYTLNDAFHHVAASRSGSTVRIFIDGVLRQSASISTNIRTGDGTQFRMGADGDSTNAYDGWIDELRVTVGVARYTSNFTVPSAAFPRTGP